MTSNLRHFGVVLGMGFAAAISAQTQPPVRSSARLRAVTRARARRLAQQQRDTFNKGFAACLEAKGYAVK